MLSRGRALCGDAGAKLISVCPTETSCPECRGLRKENDKMHGLIMKYFVLKPKGSDPYATASRMAMYAYSDSIMEENRDLGLELLRWAMDEERDAQDVQG